MRRVLYWIGHVLDQSLAVWVVGPENAPHHVLRSFRLGRRVRLGGVDNRLRLLIESPSSGCSRGGSGLGGMAVERERATAPPLANRPISGQALQVQELTWPG